MRLLAPTSISNPMALFGRPILSNQRQKARSSAMAPACTCPFIHHAHRSDQRGAKVTRRKVQSWSTPCEAHRRCPQPANVTTNSRFWAWAPGCYVVWDYVYSRCGNGYVTFPIRRAAYTLATKLTREPPTTPHRRQATVLSAAQATRRPTHPTVRPTELTQPRQN